MAEKCPYCGGEMEDMRFQSAREQGLVLLPKDYKLPVLFAWRACIRDGILLADKFSVRNGYTLNCHPDRRLQDRLHPAGLRPHRPCYPV